MDNAAQGSHSELGLPVVPFLARPKPKMPFLGLSLLRNQTQTLATQAQAIGLLPHQFAIT